MPAPKASGRFIVAIAAIAVAAIVATTALLLNRMHARELRHAVGETVSLSRIIAEQTSRAIQSADLAIRVAASQLEADEGTGAKLSDLAIHQMLASRISGMPHLRSMFIVDANGTLASASREHPVGRLYLADRDYFKVPRESLKDTLYIGTVLAGRQDGEWTLHLSRAIRRPSGEFVGVVVATLDLSYLELLYDSIRLDGVSPISLFLSDGTLVARFPHDEVLVGKHAQLPAIQADQVEPDLPLTIRTIGESPGVTTYRRISGFPFVLAVGERDRDALQDWREFSRIILTDASLGILMLLAAAIVLWRQQKHEAATDAMAREQGERLRAVVNAAMDAIITTDERGRISLFNPAAERMFGYGATQILGEPLVRLLPALDGVDGDNQSNASAAGESVPGTNNLGADTMGVRDDDTKFPVELSKASVNVDGRAQAIAVVRDISQRRRSEGELRDSNKQLRELAASLQTVREEERTEIARELHDELGQQLTRLSMELSWLATRLKDLSPVLHESAESMRTLVESTVNTVRGVTTKLRPMLLDDLGLPDAVRWQLDEFEHTTGIAIDSRIEIDDLQLDGHVTANLFRILQESLTNVVRHAEAGRVSVSLGRTTDGVLLEVRDDGRGTDLEAGKARYGHGLVGIRERVIALGGTMQVSSSPGKGFMVGVQVPCATSE